MSPTALEALLQNACRRALDLGLTFTNQIRLYRSVLALAREVRLRFPGTASQTLAARRAEVTETPTWKFFAQNPMHREPDLPDDREERAEADQMEAAWSPATGNTPSAPSSSRRMPGTTIRNTSDPSRRGSRHAPG